MKPLLACCLFLLFFSSLVYSQSKIDKKVIYQIEDFILLKQKDSALFYIKKQPKHKYLKELNELIKSNFKILSTNKKLLSNVNFRYINKYKIVSDYINSSIKLPKDTKKINKDYVYIKWKQFSLLINDRFLEESSQVYNGLVSYINNFKDTGIEVKIAKLRLETYKLRFLIIKKEIQTGKERAYRLIEEAKGLNVKDLEVVFTRYLLGFFVAEKNVDAYIKTSEKILKVAFNLEDKYEYNFLLPRLVNAYIFKKGYEEECLKLLDSLYNDEETRSNSYLYYIQIIHTNIDNRELVNRVLKKFNVNSILELIKKIKPICKKKLTDIDYLGFLKQCSLALEYNKNYNEAILLKNEAMSLNEDIYSNKLSETIANQKTEQAVKIKEKEIKIEKEKTKTYILIAIIISVFLLISLFILRKLKIQSKELSKKNVLVNKTLKEKELLVREVHHRVKNNFQIVSSLLELQSKGIEDERALELANEGKTRVKSMALIHQKLYQDKSGLVDFDEYIKLLVKELTSLYGSENKVATNISSKKMKFDVDTAIPLGLIINEIITNSYKYAFNKSKENQLSISIAKNSDHEYKLIIEDNGPGIPGNLDIKKAKSLGLRLINRLVKQLHGKLQVTNKNGARFEILFKDIYARQLIN